MVGRVNAGKDKMYPQRHAVPNRAAITRSNPDVDAQGGIGSATLAGKTLTLIKKCFPVHFRIETL
jgi:hypothetical protein